jgi:flagellar basal body-associated protein FliL
VKGHPAPYREFDATPAPGGGKRFVVAVALTLVILTGVVVGVLLWMRSTSHSDYQGPDKLAFPENRPYR